MGFSHHQMCRILSHLEVFIPKRQFFTKNSVFHCKTVNLKEELSGEIAMCLVVEEIRIDWDNYSFWWLDCLLFFFFFFNLSLGKDHGINILLCWCLTMKSLACQCQRCESGENLREKKMKIKKEQEIVFVLCLMGDFHEAREWMKCIWKKISIDFTYLATK